MDVFRICKLVVALGVVALLGCAPSRSGAASQVQETWVPLLGATDFYLEPDRERVGVDFEMAWSEEARDEVLIAVTVTRDGQATRLARPEMQRDVRFSKLSVATVAEHETGELRLFFGDSKWNLLISADPAVFVSE